MVDKIKTSLRIFRGGIITPLKYTLRTTYLNGMNFKLIPSCIYKLKNQLVIRKGERVL